MDLQMARVWHYCTGRVGYTLSGGVTEGGGAVGCEWGG